MLDINAQKDYICEAEKYMDSVCGKYTKLLIWTGISSQVYMPVGMLSKDLCVIIDILVFVQLFLILCICSEKCFLPFDFLGCTVLSELCTQNSFPLFLLVYLLCQSLDDNAMLVLIYISMYWREESIRKGARL